MLNIKNGIIPITKKVLRQESSSWFAETLTTLAIPISFYLAFGLGLRGFISDVEGFPYIVYLTPGLVTMTIMLEAYRTGGWGLWLDRWYQKMIDEYRIKPVTTSDIIIGEIIGGFIVAFIKGSIVAMVLTLLSPVVFSWHNLPLYLLYILPGSIMFTCIGTITGTLLKKPDQIAQMQSIIITPLLYLGGMFFPVTVFPESWMSFIYWLPTTALFHGGRQALLNGNFVIHDFVILWAAGIISFWIATSLFNRKLSE